MSLLTFVPPIEPSPGNGYKPEIKILDADFGDGYSQPTPEGINHIKRKVSLKWDALTREQCQELHRFFLRHKGTVPFWYQPWGEQVAQKWTCRDFSYSDDEGIWEYEADLIESFSNQV